jgi:hypothetical protein
VEEAEADGEVQEETDEEGDLDARGEHVGEPVAERDSVALGRSDLVARVEEEVVARGEEVGDPDTLDDTVAGTSRLMVCAPLSATYSTCVVDSKNAPEGV